MELCKIQASRKVTGGERFPACAKKAEVAELICFRTDKSKASIGEVIMIPLIYNYRYSDETPEACPENAAETTVMLRVAVQKIIVPIDRSIQTPSFSRENQPLPS